MHCSCWLIAQTPADRPAVYAFALWGLVVLLTALLLAVLVMRLIRMWWARSEARSARKPGDPAPDRDPWTESARRLAPEADDEDQDDEPDR